MAGRYKFLEWNKLILGLSNLRVVPAGVLPIPWPVEVELDPLAPPGMVKAVPATDVLTCSFSCREPLILSICVLRLALPFAISFSHSSGMLMVLLVMLGLMFFKNPRLNGEELELFSMGEFPNTFFNRVGDAMLMVVLLGDSKKIVFDMLADEEGL